MRKVRNKSADYTIYDSLISFKCSHTNYNFTQASVNEISSININNVMSITIFTLLKLTFILNCIGYLFSLQSLFQVYFE